MNKKHFTIILLLLVNGSFAQVKYTVTKSTINFHIKNMGFNTGGTIGGIQAGIQFDAAKPEAGSIEATANTNTLNTDNDARDEHIKSADYFDVATYPTITIKSVSLKHKSGNNYEGQFNVTIKGKTKVLPIPFTYTEIGNIADFKGVLKLKRSDFGIGGSSMVMADDVSVDIDVIASK